jgi:hypothetical protein
LVVSSVVIITNKAGWLFFGKATTTSPDGRFCHPGMFLFIQVESGQTLNTDFNCGAILDVSIYTG